METEKQNHTYGAEIEKTVSNIRTGGVHSVSQKYFERLAKAAQERGDQWHYHFSDVKPEIKLGVISTTLGEQGLDNGFNLLEGSLAYTSDPGGLEKLHQLMMLDLKSTQEALAQEGATVINMGIHPLGRTDIETYRKFVAPKGIYPYIWHRGWNHAVGIDAKAQNCPTTGVSAARATDAFSAVLGLSFASIAIFANSPIAEGRITRDKEHRSRLWKEMMKDSIFASDRMMAQFPKKRMYTLKDYFNWMFGKGTNIYFVLHKGSEKDYKTGGKIVIIGGYPSVLTYLSKPKWKGTIFRTNKKVTIFPHLSHLEMMQFSQFAGARIRWTFDHSKVSISHFLEAMKKDNVEALFKKVAHSIYIEGRDPGANFPDRELLELGNNIPKSVVIAPSAIQLGLIRNLSESVALLNKYEWSILGRLKEAAIRKALDGRVGDITVRDLTEKVLEIASRGLEKSEQWMLSYPNWVLKTGLTGADRALRQLGNNVEPKSIRQLVLSRNVILPE